MASWQLCMCVNGILAVMYVCVNDILYVIYVCVSY